MIGCARFVTLNEGYTEGIIYRLKLLLYLAPALLLFAPAAAQSTMYKQKPVILTYTAQHISAVNMPSTSSTQSVIAKPVTTTPSPIPSSTSVSNPSPTGSDKEQVADPNGPTFDLWGNEFSATGQLIQESDECVDPISGALNPVNPKCNQSNSCAPTATSQDPCKLGQCFGYPYGICESCQPANTCSGKDSEAQP